MDANEIRNKMYIIYDKIIEASRNGKHCVDIRTDVICRNPEENIMNQKQQEILKNKGYTVKLSTNERANALSPTYTISW